jgi:hypothetical protein
MHAPIEQTGTTTQIAPVGAYPRVESASLVNVEPSQTPLVDIAPSETDRQSMDDRRGGNGIVAIDNALYCRLTGCVLMPIVVDGVSLCANCVMSSPHNIIGPSASRRINARRLALKAKAAQTGDAANAWNKVLPQAQEGHDTLRVWPTTCKVVGSLYMPSTIDVGSARVRQEPNVEKVDSAHPIQLLLADSVRPMALTSAYLAHCAAQAHTSTLSVSRPVAGQSHSVLDRLVADATIARPSIMWDMRRVPESTALVLGLAAPVSDPNVAVARLYDADHPQVRAAGEHVMALARTSALVRVLGIEVALSPAAPLLRIALSACEWAVVDVGVRACYFDRETRAAVINALAQAGPPLWQACPLWRRGATLVEEATGVLGLPCNEAPVLALVLAGHDPARPVRLRLGRDAYVHASPPHQMRFCWGEPTEQTPTGDGSESRTNTRCTHDAAGFGKDGSLHSDECDVTIPIEYAQVDLAAWAAPGPGGVCLIGNCAFEGRAALVDYEANALAVFAAGCPTAP